MRRTLKALTKRGYDVLLFTDPIDQWIADTLRDLEGKKLVAVDKGARWRSAPTRRRRLPPRKRRSRPSRRLQRADSVHPRAPQRACQRGVLLAAPHRLRLLSVADENALNPSMERLMRAMNQDVPKQLRTLELNPDHAVVYRMKSDGGRQGRSPSADFADLLFGQGSSWQRVRHRRTRSASLSWSPS